MQEIVTQCIDRFIERGSADFIHDLAIPVATLATLDFVGLPLERADYYGDMMHRVVFTDKESAEYPALVESLKELFAELRVLVVQRRAKPQNDVISSLIEATVAGRKFDDGEIAELSYVLLNGGVDTSTSLSAQILLYLQRNPAEKALVLADRKLLQSAIEEWLRFFTPSLGTSRTVTTERTLSGCPLHRGDRVWLALASANRDSEEFAQPDDVILDRHPNRHVAFGWGVHRCIGMHFARQEMELIVREVCKRLPDYHIDEAAIVPYTDIGIIQGVDRMPARFTPGSVSPR